MPYFQFIPLRSFFLCYPGEALEGPISTRVSENLTMLIQITAYRYEKKLLYKKYNQLWTFIEKNAVSKNMSIKSPHEGKRAAELVEDLKAYKD